MGAGGVGLGAGDVDWVGWGGEGRWSRWLLRGRGVLGGRAVFFLVGLAGLGRRRMDVGVWGSFGS